MRTFTVFHPTPYCNLACNYCWSPNKDDGRRMPLEIVERTLTQLHKNKNVIKNDFLWLTGEPLVMGLQYFRDVVDVCTRLKPDHHEPGFIVQSNGTLIDGEWAKFFADNNFVVGVTIDGPRAVHDAQRMNKGGGGTFDAAMRGIEHLIAAGVKGGALCVITRRTLSLTPDELFNFFHERGIAWSYLIEARIGENVSSRNALNLDDLPRLKPFLSRLIELWGTNQHSYIRDFDQLSRRLFGRQSAKYDPNNLGCLDILNVCADGGFFWGNPELLSASQEALSMIRFNLAQHDVWHSRVSPEFKKIEAEIHRGVDKCRSECEYFVGCQGGNPAHKFYQYGKFDASVHVTCQLNDQTIAPLMIGRLDRALVELGA